MSKNSLSSSSPSGGVGKVIGGNYSYANAGSSPNGKAAVDYYGGSKAINLANNHGWGGASHLRGVLAAPIDPTEFKNASRKLQSRAAELRLRESEKRCREIDAASELGLVSKKMVSALLQQQVRNRQDEVHPMVQSTHRNKYKDSERAQFFAADPYDEKRVNSVYSGRGAWMKYANDPLVPMFGRVPRAADRHAPHLGRIPM